MRTEDPLEHSRGAYDGDGDSGPWSPQIAAVIKSSALYCRGTGYRRDPGKAPTGLTDRRLPCISTIS